MKTPSLSIVMPVRNAAPFVDAAMESMVRQTYSRFEFIVRDDGSTDGTVDRLRSWAARDSRIRLFEGKRSLGPAGSSNWVISKAAAPIVARMDADDIAHPQRLAMQMSVLEQDADAVLVGSVWKGIDRDGHVVREADFGPLRRPGLAAPFAHGSVMLRVDAFRRIGGYRAECDYWEDFDLYLRLSKLGRLLVIPRPLYFHRFSEASTRLASPRPRVEQAVDLMIRCRGALARGKDYTPLLAAHRQAHDETGKVHPDTFISLGSIGLWSGGRPTFLGRLIKRAKLRPDWPTLRALIWTGWAGASPASLRWTMRTLLAWRNRRALARISTDRPVEWRPASAERAESET